MTGLAHRIYIGIHGCYNHFHFYFLCYYGYTYYGVSFEERPFHPDHNTLKPSGAYGHGLGIVGTILILIGVLGTSEERKKNSSPRWVY